jgi:hypothetical protein
MADWADTCREREGLVIAPHFPVPYGEIVSDIVLGKVDAAEIQFYLPALDSFSMREWYRFLNCGYRLGVVGGTDKMSAGIPVGGVRTYANINGEEFTFANWANAVRRGRSFATSGPLIWLAVESHPPGDEIHLKKGRGTLEIEAWAQSNQPFHELQIVVNGTVVDSDTYPSGTNQARLQTKLRLKGNAWVAARCVSQYKWFYSGAPSFIAAHTSPVYVNVTDQWVPSQEEASFMLTMIEGGITWLDTLATPHDSDSQKHLREVFDSAKRRLMHK